jgi:hypothetical protein
MEAATMGRVLTEATIENLKDLWAVEQGLRQPAEARRKYSRIWPMIGPTPGMVRSN